MHVDLRPEQLAFPFSGGRLCLDFVGTVGQRDTIGYDRFRGSDDLARWVVAAGIVDRPPRVDDDGLAVARRLRESIYRSVSSAMAASGPEAVDVAVINDAAAWPTRVPQLDAETCELVWTARRPLRAALSTVARDAVELLGSGQMRLVKECAAVDCSLLFVDLSRGRRRRWCSMERCGNRQKTSTYRRRHPRV
jgi:predicted RNA-binding Zn ribbon-like protein